MKINFISHFGDGFGIAHKLWSEGREIKFHVVDPKYRNIGKGFPFVSDKLDLNWGDIYFFDMSGLGDLADKLHKAGKKVIGGGSLADKLEKDREYAIQVVKKYCPAIKIPEYRKFTNIKAGIAYIEANPEKKFCFKPDDMPAAWSFVPRKDGAGTISIMQACPKQKLNFILQEKLDPEDTVELSTEGWWDGREWRGFNHTMEEKRLMAGGVGPNCGCQGSVIWLCGRDELVESLLVPLEPLLKESGYVGPVDANCLVNEEGAYFLEYSNRMGYDAIQNLAFLDGDFGDFLESLAFQNQRGGIPPASGRYSMSVRLTMPPYPHSEDDPEHAESTEGIKPVDPGFRATQFMPVDMKLEKDEMVMAGCNNIIGTVHATGDSIAHCRDEIYKKGGVIDDIALSSDIQYRNDIGEGMQQEIEELKEWGWI